ncbi:hypothetical protein NPI06_000689, partial [Acinetobacter baumannii]
FSIDIISPNRLRHHALHLENTKYLPSKDSKRTVINMDIAHLIGDKTSQTLVMVQLTSTLLCFRPNQMFTTVRALMS